MREKQFSESKSLRGIDVLSNPTLNKGTGFTQKERKDLGLIGLLPAGIETIDQQVERVLGHLAKSPPILKGIFTWSACRTETRPFSIRS
jgi:hypothetical protein